MMDDPTWLSKPCKACLGTMVVVSEEPEVINAPIRHWKCQSCGKVDAMYSTQDER